MKQSIRNTLAGWLLGNELSALVTSAGLEIRLPALLEYGVVLLELA